MKILKIGFMIALLSGISHSFSVLAGGCADNPSDGCVVAVGSDDDSFHHGSTGGSGGGGAGSIGSGGGSSNDGSGGGNGGGYNDPRSEAEKKECRRKVDVLVTKCVDTYAMYGGGSMLLFCGNVKKLFGSFAAGGCLSAGAYLQTRSTQWCAAQGEAKKAAECG